MELETRLPPNYKSWYDLYLHVKPFRENRFVIVQWNEKSIIKAPIFAPPVRLVSAVNYDILYIEQMLLEELLKEKDDSLNPDNNLNRHELGYLLNILENKLPTSEIHLPLYKKLKKWFWEIIEKKREERRKNNSF